MKDGTLPPSIGIRIKPLNEELKRRSFRTFDLFLTTLLEKSGGTLPPNFVVTLPKITAPEQVTALASACDAFEYWRDIAGLALKFELMIETTQSVFAADGAVALPRFIAEGTRPHRRRALRDLRLHRSLRHHRRAPAHGPPGLRFREARDAGRARRHRHLAL